MKEFNLVESTSTKLIAKVNINAELQMNFKATEEGVKFGFFSRKQTVLDCIYKLFVELGINCTYITDRNGHDAVIVKDKTYDINMDENALYIYKYESVATIESV